MIQQIASVSFLVPTLIWQQVTVPWPAPFADDQYTPLFSVEENINPAQGGTAVVKVVLDHKTVNGLVFILSNTTGTPRTITLHCAAWRA